MVHGPPLRSADAENECACDRRLACPRDRTVITVTRNANASCAGTHRSRRALSLMELRTPLVEL